MTDIQKLKELAQAATQGDWSHWKHGVIKGGPVVQFFNGSSQQQIAMTTGAEWMRDGEQSANADFIAAANPAAVLELIAELDRVRDSHQQVFENYNKVSYASEERGQQIDQLKAENESLRQQLAIPSDVLADAEALRRDAERYRWLRDQEAIEGGIAILPVGLWVKPAMVCTTPFDSGEMTDSVVDAAMSKEASHD